MLRFIYDSPKQHAPKKTSTKCPKPKIPKCKNSNDMVPQLFFFECLEYGSWIHNSQVASCDSQLCSAPAPSGCLATSDHPGALSRSAPSLVPFLMLGKCWFIKGMGTRFSGVKPIFWMRVNTYKVGPPFTIAKLVNITPITMVYGTQITIVTGVYKPIYN